MAFRLVSSGGSVNDPVVINVTASGVVRPNEPVDFLRTSGVVVGPSSNSSTTTQVFGMCLDYAQGASDTFVKVIPFNTDQIWEADCANAATTAQVGLRQVLSASRGYVHNIASDATDALADNAVFLALAMTGSTSGSGKLIGRFISNVVPVGQNSTTFQ